MNRIHFETTIDAPRAKMWETMLAPDSYRAWTEAFAEGSDYEGSWETGAKIRFLTPDGDGMLSEIAESRPHEFMSIRHLGIIISGICFSSSATSTPTSAAYAIRRRRAS